MSLLIEYLNVKEQKAGTDNMLKVMLNIQHRFNPLHVHCRLVERGVNKRSSLSICRYYEIFIYSWLVWFTGVGVQICSLIKPAS